ncbi:hypothetical protein CFP56_024981, partial [Quercus suber]
MRQAVDSYASTIACVLWPFMRKKKKYPLSNGRQSPNITRRALIKLPKNHGSDKKDQSVVVILALLLGSSVFLIVFFFLISSMAVYYLYYKKVKLAWNIDRTLATN